jgi:uncharacterized UPF0160 family protein
MIKIGTHDGCPHADDVLACALLKYVLFDDNILIERSRDPSKLETCNVLVDVGGQYDPETDRYDHHMKDFNVTFSDIHKHVISGNVTCSSVGLVFGTYGYKIIYRIYNEMKKDENESELPEDFEISHSFFNLVYSEAVKEHDGHDNGIPAYDGKTAYNVNSTLAETISDMIPPKPELIDDVFVKKMMPYALEIFTNRVKTLIRRQPIYKWVLKELSTSYAENQDRVIFLPRTHVRFDRILAQIQENERFPTGFLFPRVYVQPSNRGNGHGIKGVPVPFRGTVLNRQAYAPVSWRGLHGIELQKVSGVQTANFVHPSGFCAGAGSLEDAIEMAKDFFL